MGDRSRAAVYVVKPSVQFKQPFKFDFDKPSSRDFQGEEITDHFNYGFCEMTMSTFVKTLRLAIKTLDKTLNPNYIVNQNGNLRLNDEIPMEFGGFNNFYDNKLIKNTIMPDLDKNSDELVEFFLRNHAMSEYPLLAFIKSLNPPQSGEDYRTLDPMLTQFQNNFKDKYSVIMERKQELEKLGRGAQQHKKMMREQEEERERQAKKKEEERERREREKQRGERGEKDRQRDDSSEEESRKREKKRDRSDKRSKERDSRSRSRRRSKQRRRSKDRDKDRKKKDKEKERKRSRSRNKSSDRHKKKHKD